MLAQDILGSTAMVTGFACTPGTGLQVSLAPGRIYQLANLDSTAYSSLAADTTHQIVKQGILLSAQALAVPAPTVSGDSINYLIEAAFSEVDTGSITLPYFNAANPTQAFSGVNNTGAPQFTARQGLVSLVAKAGAQATTGTQTTPAPDAGFVGLCVVTVAFGASSIVTGNITAYSQAPYLSGAQIGSNPLSGPAATPVIGAFADTWLTFHNNALASFTYDLPAIANVPAGWRTPFFATVQAGVITLTPGGSEKIGTKTAGASLASSSAAGNTIRLRAGPASTWLIESQVGTWS